MEIIFGIKKREYEAQKKGYKLCEEKWEEDTNIFPQHVESRYLKEDVGAVGIWSKISYTKDTLKYWQNVKYSKYKARE